jgi:tRNA (uracil-5-)-methyltransferase
VKLRPWELAEAHYDMLLQAKVARVAESLAHLKPPTAACFPSPPSGYRARAEFRLWHQGEDLFYAMFDPREPRDPVRVTEFPAALPAIQRRMSPLLNALRERPALRRKLFQVEFMGSRDGEALITLVYHRPLDDDWETAAQQLAAALEVSIVGRSRKQKRVLGQDFIRERFSVHGRDFVYRQYEQSFAQPNVFVNEHMLTWACDRAAALSGDLLELYCGNGNFTLPLAGHFDEVIATELSKSGTRAARENLEENGVDNVQVIRLSAEEVSQAMAGTREFRRLAQLPRPLADYSLHTVFVDPPRAGLDAATLACIGAFLQILYVSCNPQTLRANLEHLAATHRIADLAFFDQFPYTDHLESAVLLERR